jgi:tRNA (mo5U34)-methyltransferase
VDHLLELRDTLKPGGELVLETLVVDGPAGQVLVPEGRYAKMRNVWFIPSVPTLEAWIRRCGFEAVRTVDVTRTTIDEQRRTPWMTFESLREALDPDNPDLTVEGWPAPRRVVITATAPDSHRGR